MGDKLKNIIFFLGIMLVLVLGYLFFSGGDEESALVTSDSSSVVTPPLSGADSRIAGDFLSVLLSIRGITLDTTIFSDPAFLSLRDSSIELVPDGNEGRPNPFAPIGSDVVAAPLVAEPSPLSEGQMP